jgi:hypothetical protein
MLAIPRLPLEGGPTGRLPQTRGDDTMPRSSSLIFFIRLALLLGLLVPSGTWAGNYDLGSPTYKAFPIRFTLTGRLFYNDLRKIGRFEWRRDPSGARGVEVGFSEDAANYLAALDVVADIYEIDFSDGDGCIAQQKLGSATVGPHGTFTKEITAVDLCDSGALEIAVVFRTRFCNSTRCFSVVGDDGATVYRLPAEGYTPDDPATVRGGVVDLGDHYFQLDPDGHDEYAMAANVYASLVEVTRVFHRSNSIPFGKSEYGEVFANFPSTYKDIATTESATRLHIPMPSKWIGGGGPMHEYGHVLHMRTWDGSTGGCGDCPGGRYGRDGDDGWSKDSWEYPNAALGEGWGNFVRRATEKSCDEIDENSTDEPIYSASGTYPFAGLSDGDAFAGNVTKLLCDWYDRERDEDPNMPGDGDHFAASSLYSVWRNLDSMWDWVDDQEGLGICDYVRYYVDGRKSEEAVGTEKHESYEQLIADLAYQNGLECDLPRP